MRSAVPQSATETSGLAEPSSGGGGLFTPSLAERLSRPLLLRLQQQMPRTKQCPLGLASVSGLSPYRLVLRQMSKPFCRFSRPLCFVLSRFTPGSPSTAMVSGVWRAGRHRAILGPSLRLRRPHIGILWRPPSSAMLIWFRPSLRAASRHG